MVSNNSPRQLTFTEPTYVNNILSDRNLQESCGGSFLKVRNQPKQGAFVLVLSRRSTENEKIAQK